MKKTLSSFAKIRFQDCDPFNHLNNSKYIDYLINAREDQILEEYDLDMFAHIRKHNAAWVVSSHQISFLKPALIMEEVSIQSQLVQYGESNLLVEMRMLDKKEQKLKSLLWTQFTYFDLKSQQRASHPEDLMELFSRVAHPIEQKTFKDRTSSLILMAKQTAV